MRFSLLPLTAALLQIGTGSALPAERELWLTASPEDLRRVASDIAHGDPSVLPAYEDLKRDARKALDLPRFSVTDKETIAPGGNRHDYLSLDSSWVPDPAKPDGLPHVRRPGETHPGAKDPARSDAERLRAFADAVETLGLTWHYLHDEVYAEKAAVLLRAWFVDEDTRMAPHLKYAQSVPGVFPGQEEGILEGRHFIRVMQGALWLKGSAAWKESDHAAMRAWFRDYLTWLATSVEGRDERNATSNHGSWYDFQVAAVALFVGESEQARDSLNHLRSRWKTQFLPDGGQPLERDRPNALHSSVFNLLAHLSAAQLGRHAGLDLWGDPASPLEAGVRNLIPFLAGREAWPHAQSEALDPDYVLPLVRLAEGFQEASLGEEEMPSLQPDAGSARSRWRVLLPGR